MKIEFFLEKKSKVWWVVKNKDENRVFGNRVGACKK